MKHSDHIIIKTPIGYLKIIEENNHIIRIEHTCETPLKDSSKKVLKEIKEAINQYFEYRELPTNLPLQLTGTPFQIKVYQALQEIPYGTTYTYQEIANKIGHPKANRAVGNACSKNPLLLVVPCHRVIRKNGDIGGFSALIQIKMQLLNHEQATRII